MEKAALEAQEVNNFADPNMVGVDVDQPNFCKIDIKYVEPEKIVLRVDVSGVVEQWDEEGFIALCTESQDHMLKAMLAVYNLGSIAGSR
ncbi:hypothetical protein Shin27_1620 [Escherichia coli phage Shin27]|uniref:DUF7369 domain-containing protein n=8 Tax=Epseptimavirus TaxID=2732017 RepID=A0A6G9L7G6_9CAUD|nr:hypothetical protein HOU65_gp091 [Salmonella phage Seafire]YP_009858092.1 hypothetical protein HWD23_gp040 [Salmonella phage faergetype]YP_009858418.1 hypothetical protein HWD25_gp042 [Salmonella phage fuchur]ARM69810.1 hypothetical protein BSP22A_0147 [Salmonella phage BSP22A]ELI0696178.1 hypothetical protein [Salmonella enterica]QIO01351.1 hypothetical protein bobsandoy_40 [Salmonella phage bobsandoy]WFG41224.1 hypothetical protein INBLLOGA_00020 [Salmonella phage MET_P1_137_112]BEU7636